MKWVKLYILLLSQVFLVVFTIVRFFTCIYFSLINTGFYFFFIFKRFKLLMGVEIGRSALETNLL